VSNIILPICYFPPISFWAHALNAKEVILDSHEYYIKQTPRSRCKIYSVHGEQNLTIPVDKAGSKTAMNRVKIVDYEPWRKVHLKALESAYSASPFFEFYVDDLKPILEGNQTNLIDFNLEGLNWINKVLDLGICFKQTDSFQKTYPFTDLRPGKKNEFNPRESLAKYNQVFMDKGNPFISNLSILDLLFNLGNEARVYLNDIR
jgi:hypothetical protein